MMTPEQIAADQTNEQVAASIRTVAGLVWAYYDELRRRGFETDQAMFLTGAYAEAYWDRIIFGLRAD